MRLTILKNAITEALVERLKSTGVIKGLNNELENILIFKYSDKYIGTKIVREQVELTYHSIKVKSNIQGDDIKFYLLYISPKIKMGKRKERLEEIIYRFRDYPAGSYEYKNKKSDRQIASVLEYELDLSILDKEINLKIE